VPKSLSENLELLRFTSVKVETTFFKRYYNSIFLLMQLGKCERVLMDFIVEEMDDKNYVTNSIQLRGKLNYMLQKMGQEAYADGTFQKSFKNLCEISLVIKSKGRGLYQINPLYFFKGTEEDRQKAIRFNLEKLNKIPINKLRRELLIEKHTT
jgi:hypothetical protein